MKRLSRRSTKLSTAVRESSLSTHVRRRPYREVIREAEVLEIRGARKRQEKEVKVASKLFEEALGGRRGRRSSWIKREAHYHRGLHAGLANAEKLITEVIERVMRKLRLSGDPAFSSTHTENDIDAMYERLVAQSGYVHDVEQVVVKLSMAMYEDERRVLQTNENAQAELLGRALGNFIGYLEHGLHGALGPLFARAELKPKIHNPGAMQHHATSLHFLFRKIKGHKISMGRLSKMLRGMLRHPDGWVVHDPVHMRACMAVVKALKTRITHIWE